MKRHEPPKSVGALIPKGVRGAVLRAENLAHPTPGPPRLAQPPKVLLNLEDGVRRLLRPQIPRVPVKQKYGPLTFVSGPLCVT